MIKRMSKVTSLLVAAASIASMVPAMAADYTKIESQDGTVYNAVAYKDGKFYIDGEVEGKDEAVYYISNGKYTDLSDLDSGSSVENYGSKYVNVEDGDYFVNLEDGSVTDDSIKENAEDDAASALRKALKKDNDGRYESAQAEAIQDLEDAELIGNKFSETWYGFKYTRDNETNGSNTVLNVYTDGKGNYIDADYNLGSIKVTTTATAGTTTKTATINNTDDSYDAAGTNGDDKLSASVDSENAKVIGQDSNNIYRLAKVTVKVSNESTITKINGVEVSTDSNTFDTTTSGSVSFNVIQKISKAQSSSDVDGAKYAKSVTTYIIADKDGKNEDFSYANYTIANGKVVGYEIENGELKTQTATLSSKNGFYYTDLGDEASEEVEANGVETDVDGNLWRLDSGYIYKWDNDEDWTKVYKVDGSFDKLSVYDANNMVAWNEDDEVYSVIAKNNTDTDTDTDDNDTNVTTGWVQAADGTWSYNKADGTKATGWLKDGSTWYYLNASGIMQTGWLNDNGTWYYLNGSGAMQTGWVNVNGTWYYLNGSGAMQTGWLNDNGTWYYLQSSGAMATGWLNDNGTWYYLNASGAMLSNTTVDGYVLGANGAWIK